MRKQTYSPPDQFFRWLFPFPTKISFSLRNKPSTNPPIKSFVLICATFAVCVCSGTWQLQANPAPTATATIQFTNGSTMTVTDLSNQIGIQPRDYANITVQISPAPAGQPVIIEPLDGGSTSFGASIPVIDSNGSISFGFHAPGKTGIKSISIRVGSTRFLLHFSVLKAN